MIPAALLDVIADEAGLVRDLARQAGATISIDPRAILARDIALGPAGLVSPNGHCRMVESADGWIAVNLAREDDRASVAAWLECDDTADPWSMAERGVRHRTSADLVARATLLGMPVAAVGETQASRAQPEVHDRAISGDRGLRVIDLSALWAGPLCGAILAQAGMAVTKVEDPRRPDPTAISTPDHDRRLNGAKQRCTMALASAALLDAIAGADILITSARAHALERLGLVPGALLARNPQLVWVAITAHGLDGDNAMRVGFGDDAAAAGGLVLWSADRPHFMGDALADPLTGLRAAHLALHAMAEGRSGLIDVALAPTAADFARKAGLQ